MGGGIARWMGELAKHYPAGSLVVSTGRHSGSMALDRSFPNRIDRIATASERLRTIQGTFLWARRVSALASQSNVEFIWCGNLKPASYPARWAKLRTGVPYGVLLHGGDLLILRDQAQRSLLKRRAAHALLGSAAVLVSNSTWTSNLCRAVMNQVGLEFETSRVRVVPLGADPLVFRPGVDSTEVRRRYGLNRGRWLLTVARLTAHKGIDTGIRVVAQLATAYPELVYAVVGSGDQLPGLEKLAQSLGVLDRVRFFTDVPDTDLPAFYNCAEIYLGLSRATAQGVEGFGISLAEASACGLPIVAGRSGGIPDAVRDGETGLLVDPEQPAGAAAAVKVLLEDRALASRLGAEGRRSVETYFNWNRVAGDLARLGQEYGAPTVSGR